MESTPLVSIITPCYNAEKTIGRLIQSVLDQTYDNIELIIVNDGSIDNSGDVIESYRAKVIERGFKFQHYIQENKGLGGAINSGLKLFHGDFFCWPDADDYLEPDSVAVKLKYLLDNPDYAVVTSNAYIRKANDLEHFKLLVADNAARNYEINQFRLLLNGDSIFCSGCHMMRTSAFLDVNPQREIYEARRGQNWQVLLPVYFKYKRGYINTPLYNYIDYPNSMSKDVRNESWLLERYEGHYKILINTLRMIEINQHVDLREYIRFVNDRHLKLKMSLALEFNNKENFIKAFKEKKELVGLDVKDFLRYVMFKLNISNNSVRKIVHFIR